MTTITPSPIRNPARHRRAAGFSLVEIIIGAGLSAFILAGTLSTFLFLGRSSANIQNYADMESQARRALEIFSHDARQAGAIIWTSSIQITITVDAASVVYAYSAVSGSFTRTDASGTRTLITGITPGTFTFRPYNLSGVPLPLTTPDELAAAGTNTKQLQLSLETERSQQTAVTATNAVLSARFILRNKIVTA